MNAVKDVQDNSTKALEYPAVDAQYAMGEHELGLPSESSSGQLSNECCIPRRQFEFIKR
jgi:hypothetical protein